MEFLRSRGRAAIRGVRKRFCSVRLCAAWLMVFALTPAAAATDFTDIWFIPQESGWGVNIVQSDSFLFATFFIYGSDKAPTWYTALLTFDGTRYAGGLYRTEGSFWANPWNPAEPFTACVTFSANVSSYGPFCELVAQFE